MTYTQVYNIRKQAGGPNWNLSEVQGGGPVRLSNYTPPRRREQPSTPSPTEPPTDVKPVKSAPKKSVPAGLPRGWRYNEKSKLYQQYDDKGQRILASRYKPRGYTEMPVASSYGAATTNVPYGDQTRVVRNRDGSYSYR